MEYIFDIEPQSQLRPRAGFNKYTHHLSVFDPQKTREFKRQLRQLASNAVGHEPLTEALNVELFFYRRINKSVTKKEHRLQALGIHRPTTKPDVDNYIKATLDSLNGLLWNDDKQIVDLSAHKFYSEHPRIQVKISSVSTESAC